MNPLLIDVDEIINEILYERRWKYDMKIEKVNLAEIEKSLHQGISRWTRLMVILSSSELFTDVERIADAIISLKAYLNDLFSKVRHTRNHFFLFKTLRCLFQKKISFTRDIFRVHNLAVSCVQYVEPMKFYPSSNFVYKHMAFLVFQDNKVILRYYLESTNIFESYYVLCSMSSDMLVHKQIKQYGNVKPKYSELKRMIILDISNGKNTPPFIIKAFPFSISNSR